jgi:hypothetical protein
VRFNCFMRTSRVGICVFASGHLTSGIAVGLALGLHDTALAVFIVASVFTDWDYAFQLLTGRNHRTFLTHSPPVYVAILLPLGFFTSHLVWVALAGSMLHFTLDLWDYGIRLNPFSREIFGARLLVGSEEMRFADYLRAYFRDRRFAAAEAGFALAAVGLIVARGL